MNSGAAFFCADAKTGAVAWTDPTRRGQCGTILDAGSVLLGLTSDMHLIVIAPNSKEYVEVAKIKVAETENWAPFIVAGNRLFVKDSNSLSLLVIE